MTGAAVCPLTLSGCSLRPPRALRLKRLLGGDEAIERSRQAGRKPNPVSAFAEATADAAMCLGRAVAGRLERPTRGSSGAGRTIAPYLALLPVGFAVPPVSPRGRCALTAPFHPCLWPACGEPIGGLISVALSLGFRPVGVTHHRTLWSSDFPPAPTDRDRRPHCPLAGLRGYYTRKRARGAMRFGSFFPQEVARPWGREQGPMGPGPGGRASRGSAWPGDGR